MRGLWKLTWLEIKIFLREPLGAFGTIVVPVLMFIALGAAFGRRASVPASPTARLVAVDVPVLASLLIALSAALSLATVVSIYREGGILKRLRATPLRPHTILSAHVLVKLLLTAVTWALMIAAGRRYYPVDIHAPVWSFTLALLLTTACILSIGFVIASVVPTARFAQPLGAIVLYPMLAVSGLFVPADALPPAVRIVSRAVPLTYAVSLLRGIWKGEPWSAHLTDVAALVVVLVVCTALSAKIFRWE
jgi:ABC-2 type transport system permease protein